MAREVLWFVEMYHDGAVKVFPSSAPEVVQVARSKSRGVSGKVTPPSPQMTSESFRWWGYAAGKRQALKFAAEDYDAATGEER
jgi:hypothetical protein